MIVYVTAHQRTESIKALLDMFLIYLKKGENASTCRNCIHSFKKMYIQASLECLFQNK